MDPCRPVLAAFVISLTFSFAACFGSPTRKAPTTAAHGSSSSGAGGRGATTSKGSSVATTSTSGTGAAGTGGAGVGGGEMGGGGTGGMMPIDDGGGFMDVAADVIGKGGLPLGAMCGAYGVGDGGSKCGEGLACCSPCMNGMCDTFCALACNPKMKGCIGGCFEKP